MINSACAAAGTAAAAATPHRVPPTESATQRRASEIQFALGARRERLCCCAHWIRARPPPIPKNKNEAQREPNLRPRELFHIPEFARQSLWCVERVVCVFFFGRCTVWSRKSKRNEIISRVLAVLVSALDSANRRAP